MPSTILIVDDSSTMRNALKVYLRDPALAFAEAETAERALALARLLRPSLVLCDLNLPGMDGLEFTRRLRQEARDRIPVLLVTGEEAGEWQEKSVEAGADGLVRKPVDATALKTRVTELLAGRAS